MMLLKTSIEPKDETITFADWIKWFETLLTSAKHEAERTMQNARMQNATHSVQLAG